MKTKLTFLLAFTFLFLFSGSSVVFGDDHQDGVSAFWRADYKTAFEKLMPSASRGNEHAQGLIGFMYANGRGVTQNYARAFKWYKLSAEQGNAGSQSFLGQMYSNGWGVPQDYDEAAKWYWRSARQGQASGQIQLGMMYAHGQGVNPNYVEALKWYIIAGVYDLGLWKEHIDSIKEQLSPAQIAEAKKLAREWMKEHGK